MDKLITENRHKIMELAEKYGVKEIRLFGSFLHGTHTDESDVDFLVVFEEQRDLLDLAGFKLDMQELLGRDVDVVNKSTLYKTVANHVLSEAVAI